MRFDLPESITAMRKGLKCQTRRRDGRLFWFFKPPGSRITIVHNGEYLGYAIVRTTWRHQFVTIGEGTAKAEGYASAAAFQKAWRKMYPNARPDDWVTAIEFGDIRWRGEAQDG